MNKICDAETCTSILSYVHTCNTTDTSSHEPKIGVKTYCLQITCYFLGFQVILRFLFYGIKSENSFKIWKKYKTVTVGFLATSLKRVQKLNKYLKLQTYDRISMKKSFSQFALEVYVLKLDEDGNIGNLAIAKRSRVSCAHKVTTVLK